MTNMTDYHSLAEIQDGAPKSVRVREDKIEMREDVKLFSWMSDEFKNPYDIPAIYRNILSRDTCFLWELTWQTLVITNRLLAKPILS